MTSCSDQTCRAPGLGLLEIVDRTASGNVKLCHAYIGTVKVSYEADQSESRELK